MRRLLSICLTLLCAITVWAQEQRMQFSCGTWIKITATPYDEYRFVGWSDGDTSRVRTIQVNEDIHYIAYFANQCREYANWPIVVKYDWLLMLNLTAINAEGYYFGPEAVKWYRVVGQPDSLNSVADDQLVVEGSYYLTLDRNLQGSGDYYAQVDISSSASGQVCTDYMRSVIVHFSSPKSPSFAPYLEPSFAPVGTPLTLHGLPADQQTDIFVYEPGGRLISTYSTQGEEHFTFQAGTIPGCYFLHVVAGEEHVSLKYILSW